MNAMGPLRITDIVTNMLWSILNVLTKPLQETNLLTKSRHFAFMYKTEVNLCTNGRKL